MDTVPDIESASFIEIERSMGQQIKELQEFIDYNIFNRIINKLTDYAEILSEGKLAGIINYSYNLNSTQTSKIIDFLVFIQALSKIYNIALKGVRDLEIEYVSNIFSDVSTPSNISSYLSLRNILENRLSHQTQQYNMNMGKANTTMSMPINELKGHVKSFRDLTDNKVSISTKVQHGIISASLHDAYVTLLNRKEFWNDRTYMKFFFNEDDMTNREKLLVTKHTRLSLEDIDRNVKNSIEMFYEKASEQQKILMREDTDKNMDENLEHREPARRVFLNDKMLMTPFGRQYGSRIDSIIVEIFSNESRQRSLSMDHETIKEKIVPLFELYTSMSDISEYSGDIDEVVTYLLYQDYGIRSFAEYFLYNDKKVSFHKFYDLNNKEKIEFFLEELFTIYFNHHFGSIFRIIRSLDLRKFACAYIMKRIYMIQGDELSAFGFFLIKTIAKIGGIKTNM